MSGIPIGAPELFRAVGLRPDGPAVIGRPFRAPRPGVYAVELAAPLASAPVDLALVGRWIERVPGMRIDGEPATGKTLATRLGAFWLPSTSVLFVGAAENSVGGRIAALERHVLGDRQPHASSHWLKTLKVTGLRVWWAETDAREEYEDALLGAFADAVDAADRAALHDPNVILPFANLRRPDGTPKAHGITGSLPPAEVAPAVPPTRLVEVAPGDAEGARVERKGSGTKRPARAPTVRRTPTPKAPPSRAAEPLVVSADGLSRLQAEHETLVARRPGVVARIRAAKELGDLKENSDYTAAREEQSFLEGRIQAIEAQLRVAVVADAPADRSRVAMGSRVGVEHDGDAFTLHLVGPTESDAAAGRISVSSPVGRALLGAEVGQEVAIRTPGGEVRYRVTTLD